MSKTTELSSVIWSAADDVLRGLFRPSEYGRVILPFVVMRRLDCVLEPKKDEIFELYEKYKNQLDPTPIIQKQVGLPFYNRSKYDLSRIKSDPNNVLINFNNYVQGYSPNVLEIIENFSLEPLVEKLHKNKRLYQLIDKFTEFDLHPNNIDNHAMGSVYEELLRRFSEMSNEESGDHFTPRDIVKLLVTFVFGGDKENLQGQGKIRSVFDPCCGTGGMLTIGKEWVLENINKDLKIELYGQELNDVTYSICKSDVLMSGENPENIHGPCSSLSDDRLQGKKFDYMITNPPFGVSWKSEEEFISEEAKDPNGRFFVGTPRITDGSLLFLQHLISKMNPNGSRIGIVLNGSPLFSGDAGSGESEIRKWVIENDWLETIIQLPDQMFFNTGITTYILIVTNKKTLERKGKVQLIDGSSFFQTMKKSLGSKRKLISPEQSEELFKMYSLFKDSEFSKIYSNNFFGYTKIIIEQPLIVNGEIVKDKKGDIKSDTSLRDTERITLSDDIDVYYKREILPNLPRSWMDRSKDKIGYEINFTKYFYKFTQLKSIPDISNEIKKLDAEIEKLSKEISITNYSEYKDSEIQWVGKIPSHWNKSKLTYIGKFYGGLTGKSGEDFGDESSPYNKLFIPFTNIANNIYISKEDLKTVKIMDSDNQNRVLLSDILFLMSSENYKDLGKTSILNENIDELYLNSFCKGFRIEKKEVEPKYLNYQLLNNSHRQLISIEGNGFTRINLRSEKLKNIPIFLPPIEEQKLISKCLDKNNNEIDLLIKKFEKKIALLKEYKESFISSLVTGKIKPTEDMI
jgi:type I restriction enzyme M protein